MLKCLLPKTLRTYADPLIRLGKSEPSFLCGFRSRGALAVYHLRGEIHIGAASRALVIVKKKRLAVRRRFCNAHVPRDDGVIDLVAEEAAHLGCNFVGELRPAIVHGQNHAMDFERGIEARNRLFL